MTAHNNPKRERFCQEYLRDLNGTQAAIRAGYSKKSATRQACQMLTEDPAVQARVQELMAERSERTGIKLDRVIEEYAAVAFANISDFFTIDADGQPVMDLSDRKKADLAIISEISSEIVLESRGEGQEPDRVRKTRLKLHDKMKALKDLGQHLGMFGKSEGEAIDTLAAAVREISARGSAAPISTAGDDDA